MKFFTPIPRMISLTCALILSAMIAASAQVEFNPQIGVNFTNLSEEPVIVEGVEVETEGKAGLMIGADLRLGNTVYFQPGVFVLSSKTVYSYGDSILVDPSDVTRWDARLEGMAGVYLVDNDFKLRAMAGPAYTFNINRDSDDNPYFEDDEFREGTFSLDLGLGIDVMFLTAELGYSFGLTDVFDDDIWDNAPRYQMLYFTVGFVVGE